MSKGGLLFIFGQSSMPSRKANYSDRQAGTEETQMTAKEEKVRAEGGGAIIIIIILFTVGKRHV